MAKRHASYVCQECGTVFGQWAGRCTACEAWNSIVEDVTAPPPPGAPVTRTKGKPQQLETLQAGDDEAPRITTRIMEFDRVTGGGVVPGSALLIGGEPGIGKSTLLLQLSAAVAQNGGKAIYFTGEEATAQIRLRAKRLGLGEAPVALVAESNLANILATIGTIENPDLIVIDSVQTLWSDGLESAPGTVSQVRATTQSLVRHVKNTGACLLLVGHVTKEGQIAGPKVVEHMVDTVLYFEGDRGHPFRILRAVKNRYGATEEIGVFEMVEEGLRGIENPSAFFLGDREIKAPGGAVFAGIEGTRPILAEVQALVAPTALGTPRRAVVGWDASRLAMLLAVLDARCGISLSGHDVYLNIAGGLKIVDPAADLAAAAALVSSLSGVALPSDSVYIGEISLSGALRPVSRTALRLKEARKLGFKTAVMSAGGDVRAKSEKLALRRYDELRTLTKLLYQD